MEQHKVLYEKKGSRYVPVALNYCERYDRVQPVGIEVIIRSGDGWSRHWHFASIDQIHRDYDWMLEAVKMLAVNDINAIVMDAMAKAGSIDDISTAIVNSLTTNIKGAWEARRNKL